MKLTPVEKKQWELRILSIFLLLCSGGTAIVFSLVSEQPRINTLSLGFFFVVFCAYTVDKEIKLQKTQSRLRDEQFKVLEEEVKISALEGRLKELATMHKAMTAIQMETQPQKALNTILRAAMDLFDADRGSIMRVDEESRTLKIVAVVGVNMEEFPKSQPKIGEGIAGMVVQTGEAVLLPQKINPELYKNFETKNPALRSGICAPLWSRRKIMGVINYTILDPKKRLFTEYDLKLLTIFAQYATLVVNDAEAARLT